MADPCRRTYFTVLPSCHSRCQHMQSNKQYLVAFCCVQLPLDVTCWFLVSNLQQTHDIT